MKKAVVGSLTAAALISTAALAGDLPVDVHGGVSAGYQYQYTDSDNEGFFVSNALVELSKEAKEGIGFTLGFGYLAANAGSTATGDNFGLQYGY